MGTKHVKFHCKSEAQKKAIAASYARKSKQQQNPPCNTGAVKADNKEFPNKFPFWARLKIDKRRTTLVIDEAPAKDNHGNVVDGYVHREATHNNPRGDFEEITPNPDKDDSKSMYLKRPRKHPKYLFEPHNKDLDMPEDLQKRYEKNNRPKNT